MQTEVCCISCVCCTVIDTEDGNSSFTEHEMPPTLKDLTVLTSLDICFFLFFFLNHRWGFFFPQKVKSTDQRALYVSLTQDNPSWFLKNEPPHPLRWEVLSSVRFLYYEGRLHRRKGRCRRRLCGAARSGMQFYRQDLLLHTPLEVKPRNTHLYATSNIYPYRCELMVIRELVLAI